VKYLRHDRTSPERWAYDPATRTVLAHFVDGDVEIPVCSQAHPRGGAFFIARRGEDSWQVSPARCTTSFNGFVGQAASYDENGVHGDFLHLSGAPGWVNDLLGTLSTPPEESIADDAPTLRWCPRCEAKGFTKDGECPLCEGNRVVSFEDAYAWEQLSHD
jgi:hypothetical protein